MLRFIRENALIIYPILLITSFYSTWLAARYHLGHWPIASIDDPKYIEGFWMWTYTSTILLLLIGWIVALLFAVFHFIVQYSNDSIQNKTLLLKNSLGIALTIAAFWIIGNEPNDILVWLLD